jgi:hypothetical protein
MTRSTPDLRRARRIIAAVLVVLAGGSTVLAVTGVWPSAILGEWLGSDSLRLRFASAFAVVGAGLLAVLLVAVAIKKLVLRRRRDAPL